MLSERQITRVRSSFVQVEANAATISQLFYRRLFKRKPSLRTLFGRDMEIQGAKLIKSLKLAVGALADLDRVAPLLRSLGRRHVAYGVKNAHYDIVGEVLLQTLAEGLDNFDDDLWDAWLVTYARVATLMKDAANEAERAGDGRDDAQSQAADSSQSENQAARERARRRRPSWWKPDEATAFKVWLHYAAYHA